MRTKLRKPRRKKSRFKFCTKASAGYLMKHDSSFTFKSVEAKHLGDYGYHTYFYDSYTVFHLPTGLEIENCSNKKEAITLIKRLFIKNIKVRLKPSEIIPMVELITFLKDRLTGSGLYVTHRTIHDSPDDIPF